MKYIVVDTSYLLHLFDVDGRSTPAARARIMELFKLEAEQGSIFHVPVPVIFELCNFVAQVANGASRRRLAGAARSAISRSLQDNVPWTISPFEGVGSMIEWVKVLDRALTDFEDEFVNQQIGLSDISVITTASDLKIVADMKVAPKPSVHIWTTDEALKAREPDAEANAFLG